MYSGGGGSVEGGFVGGGAVGGGTVGGGTVGGGGEGSEISDGLVSSGGRSEAGLPVRNRNIKPATTAIATVYIKCFMLMIISPSLIINLLVAYHVY